MEHDHTQRWLSDPQAGEVFVPPTGEARFLLRHVPGLVAPSSPDRRPGRTLRDLLVAPFPQLSLFSFDLQAYLFELLHGSWLARVGHFVGMLGAVTCLLALFAATLGSWASISVAVFLAVYWGAVAERARLTAWGFVMIPILAAMTWGALTLGEQVPAGWAAVAWLGFGVVTAGSHLGEALQPPRAFDPENWCDYGEFMRGEGAGAGRSMGARVLLSVRSTLAGIVSELWAAQRLLPYNVLFLMFALGYRPDVRATLRERVVRAWASGNPALDYVGVGGGATLRLPDDDA